MTDTDTATEGSARSNGKRRTDWGRHGARPLYVLSAVALIDTIDRGILSGVLSEVQKDLGFSDTQAGWLATAFIITGFLVTLPAGYLADRFSRTRIIAVVLTSWGVISAMTSIVSNFGQMLAVRAALGIGETIDNPSSQSLIADYYRPEVRGRAYGLQRLAPVVGGALGIGLGGLVGSLFGWRAAFLVVGVPGSLLAVAVWRLAEPQRGESDPSHTEPEAIGDGGSTHTEPEAIGDGPRHSLPRAGFESVEVPPAEAAAPLPPPLAANGARALVRDVRRALDVRTLRSLMIGSAIVAGATTGLSFWAASYYERHTSLGSGGGAGVASALILVGALVGTYFGGRTADRLRDRYEGTPMLIAGVSQCAGGALLTVTFLPVPMWFRLPAQMVAVALIVAGLPGLAAMTSEVVPAAVRGTAFSMTTFLSMLASAGSPLLIGFVADQFPITVDGEVKGHLGHAFTIVTPFVIAGALIVLRGRRHVATDTAAARLLNPATPA